MFIYSFKKPSMIKHVVITDKHITFYTSKEHQIETQALTQFLKLKKGPIADSPQHMFAHNPADEMFTHDQFFGPTHQHYEFATADRLGTMTAFCEFVASRLANSAERQADHTAFMEYMNADRIRVGDAVFPPQVKAILDAYDMVTPYVDLTEARDMLQQFTAYVNADHAEEMISSYASALLGANWETLYYDLIDDIKPTAEKAQLANYYVRLLALRVALLKMERMPDLTFFSLAIQLPAILQANPCFEKNKEMKEHAGLAKALTLAPQVARDKLVEMKKSDDEINAIANADISGEFKEEATTDTVDPEPIRVTMPSAPMSMTSLLDSPLANMVLLSAMIYEAYETDSLAFKLLLMLMILTELHRLFSPSVAALSIFSRRQENQRVELGRGVDILPQGEDLIVLNSATRTNPAITLIADESDVARLPSPKRK